MSRITAITVLLTVTLAGCGGTPDTGSLEPPPGGDVAASGSEEPSPSPEPEPEPTSDAGLPDAADGSGLDACADGDCEVRVSESDEIPIDPSFGIDNFTVAEIGPDMVVIEGTGAGAYVRTSVGTQGRSTLNGITVQILAIDGDQAVLSLSS